jgi:hypothetical protein
MDILIIKHIRLDQFHFFYFSFNRILYSGGGTLFPQGQVQVRASNDYLHKIFLGLEVHPTQHRDKVNVSNKIMSVVATTGKRTTNM